LTLKVSESSGAITAFNYLRIRELPLSKNASHEWLLAGDVPISSTGQLAKYCLIPLCEAAVASSRLL
jgi:hypothetical protein